MCTFLVNASRSRNIHLCYQLYQFFFLHLFKLTFILKYLKVMPAIVCCVNWSISKCQNPLSSEDEKYFRKSTGVAQYVMCIVPYCDNTLHWILILLKKSIQYIYNGMNKSIQLHIVWF